MKIMATIKRCAPADAQEAGTALSIAVPELAERMQQMLAKGAP